MKCVRLGVGVTLVLALVTASWAQERATPMEFPPDDVRPDAGARAATETPPPAQEEDREAAPITKGASKPEPPKPAPVAAPAPVKPAPPPPKPKAEKPKKEHAQKAPPPPTEPPPPAVPPH